MDENIVANRHIAQAVYDKLDGQSIREATEKFAWRMPIILVYIFGSVAALSLTCGHYLHGVEGVIITFCTVLGIKVGLKRHSDICHEGKLFPAVITGIMVRPVHTHFTARVVMPTSTEQKVVFSLCNPRYVSSRKYPHYRQPKIGEEIIVYYLPRHARYAAPPITQFI